MTTYLRRVLYRAVWYPRLFLRLLKAEYHLRPVATAVAVGLFPLGVLVLFLGEGASRAFTIVGQGTMWGSIIAHVMGLLMLTGGFLAVAGILRRSTLVEMLGMVGISAGSAIYAGGVILGLGWNGSVSAAYGLIVAFGTGGRVYLLGKEADRLAQREETL